VMAINRKGERSKIQGRTKAGLGEKAGVTWRKGPKRGLDSLPASPPRRKGREGECFKHDYWIAEVNAPIGGPETGSEKGDKSP